MARCRAFRSFVRRSSALLFCPGPSPAGDAGSPGAVSAPAGDAGSRSRNRDTADCTGSKAPAGGITRGMLAENGFLL